MEVSKVKSSVYPDLERVPGKQNWVDHAGGLPSYIERIAKHLVYENGMTIGHAIATAVNQCKKWAAGMGNVNPDTKMKAAKAIAQWEAKKAKSHVSKEYKAHMFKKGATGMCEKCGKKAGYPMHRAAIKRKNAS